MSVTALELRILSVNVARPRLLALDNGETFTSAIGKQPLAARTVTVGRTNLDGDAQADLEHHGGGDKKGFGYPPHQWALVENEAGVFFRARALRRNLIIQDADGT